MQKKVLVFNPGTLFPTKAMNQVRTINMIRSLSAAFHVDVATPVRNEEERSQSTDGIGAIARRFFPLVSKKRTERLAIKRMYQLMERLGYYVLGHDMGYTASRHLEKPILRLIRDNAYDFVISNYWEASTFFARMNGNIVKILDTHYAVEENVRLHSQGAYKVQAGFFKDRELRKSLQMERNVIQASDVIVSLSNSNYATFTALVPDKRHIMIPDGNDVAYFSAHAGRGNERNIVFYGNMGSAQNKEAFFRFYHRIFPAVRARVEDVKLIVVGAHPAPDIEALHDGDSIIVTGYQADVRPFLSRGRVKVLPMERGSGFRGRIVEIMAMGIPVIGTPNALDSIEMQSGVHGYVTDSDEEMIGHCTNLLTDDRLHRTMSDACMTFAHEKYSLEATFDRFTRFLLEYA